MWMTSAFTCWATVGSRLCSQDIRTDRCEIAVGPATTRAPGASRPYRSSSALWQTTARSAPATSRAPISPSTYRPSAPRSAGTSVASISTRGATTALAPFLGHPDRRAAGNPCRPHGSHVPGWMSRQHLSLRLAQIMDEQLPPRRARRPGCASSTHEYYGAAVPARAAIGDGHQGQGGRGRVEPDPTAVGGQAQVHSLG